MKKLLYGIIILLVFTSCNQEVKKQSYTIEYLKSNKWCIIKDSKQLCLEFSDNEMIGFVDGKQQGGSIPLKLEQRSDSLIVFILDDEFDPGQEGSIRMKSLDTLSIHDSTEQLGDFVKAK